MLHAHSIRQPDMSKLHISIFACCMFGELWALTGTEEKEGVRRRGHAWAPASHVALMGVMGGHPAGSIASGWACVALGDATAASLGGTGCAVGLAGLPVARESALTLMKDVAFFLHQQHGGSVPYDLGRVSADISIRWGAQKLGDGDAGGRFWLCPSRPSVIAQLGQVLHQCSNSQNNSRK